MPEGIGMGFSRKDDANGIATLSFAVTDDQHAALVAHARHDEAVFFGGMLFIKIPHRIFHRRIRISPFGSGTGSPNSRAVSIHGWMTSLAFADTDS